MLQIELLFLALIKIISKMSVVCQQSGLESPKFVDIDKLEHRFPPELKEIGFTTSLLHNHSHAPKGHLLVYKKDFSVAEYASAAEVEGYFPCSWYLENDIVRAYEFCDVKLDFQLKDIKEKLALLDELGYLTYGVSVRPIKNVTEFETESGHIYVPTKEAKLKEDLKYSETASDGLGVDGCFYVCAGGNGGHYSKHW